MLVQNLRNLERIRREVYPTIPPQVDYSLTVLGKSLAEPLAVLGEWAYQHIADVHACVEQYDNRPQSESFWQPK